MAVLAKGVGRGGRVMAGTATAEVVAAEEAAPAKILATVDECVTASANMRLWRWRPRSYRYK